MHVHAQMSAALSGPHFVTGLQTGDKHREEDRLKLVSMEAQLNQSSSGSRVQLDRANERLQSYERALFDARCVSASAIFWSAIYVSERV